MDGVGDKAIALNRTSSNSRIQQQDGSNAQNL